MSLVLAAWSSFVLSAGPATFTPIPRPATLARGTTVAYIVGGSGDADVVDAKGTRQVGLVGLPLVREDTLDVKARGLLFVQIDANKQVVRIDDDIQLAVKDIALLEAPAQTASLDAQLNQLLTPTEKKEGAQRMMGWHASMMAANVPSTGSEKHDQPSSPPPATQPVAVHRGPGPQGGGGPPGSPAPVVVAEGGGRATGGPPPGSRRPADELTEAREERERTMAREEGRAKDVERSATPTPTPEKKKEKGFFESLFGSKDEAPAATAGPAPAPPTTAAAQTKSAPEQKPSMEPPESPPASPPAQIAEVSPPPPPPPPRDSVAEATPKPIKAPKARKDAAEELDEDQTPHQPSAPAALQARIKKDRALQTCLDRALTAHGPAVRGLFGKSVSVRVRVVAGGVEVRLPKALPTPACAVTWFEKRRADVPAGDAWSTVEVPLP